MNLAESITFMFYGILLLFFIAIAWFVFRKRKKWAVGVTAVLLIGYIGYYAYYPVSQANEHAEKYEQVTEYLASNYPDRQFTVIPKRYEVGYSVGTFEINERDTPHMGVTLHVDDEGGVQQLSNWTNVEFPQQQDLWRELDFHYGGNYTLDRESVEITKQDEWIEGELTVFALDIDGKPAIAIYEYLQAGYAMLDLQESENEAFVFAETEGRVFVYIDENYKEDTVEVVLQDGTMFSVDTADRKGQLFLLDQ
ncbi:MAG TPA: hypothetical protein VK947_08515 [Planococcus sp. (in: firmicutes)]|nr:hypothetical protein [Planococcus sp. (in: firmicutes)]